MKNQAFAHMDSLEWESVDPGVSRKIGPYSESLMAVCVKFETGAVGALHHHPHTQISFVESGSLEVTIDGTTETLQRGDFFLARPDLEHGVKALEPSVLIDVFNPMRADFVSPAVSD